VKRAWCDIREKPHYRAEAFEAGLRACGFHVLMRQLPSAPPAPGDVLVLWNRYSDREQAGDRWEQQGGTVLVAENGYIGRDAAGHQLYALARHGHNGSGEWDPGGPERWQALGVELKAWREGGEHILVAPNRHFGMKGLAMPYGWENEIVKRLRAVTKRPIRVRPHPQNAPAARPLSEDLENCFAMVIWASSAGVHALAAGVPVVSCSPWWILKNAALERAEDVEMFAAVGPWERMAADVTRRVGFERLAWAQWSVEELARGDPFQHLLRADVLPAAGQAQVAQAA
jgi:hypothetical protein